MVYSKSGLKLTEQFEGCKLVAYQDQAGVWTIGYGHTYNVFKGMTCSEFQAELWMMQDIASASCCVNLCVRVPLTQNEFDALVDFTYNIGNKNFEDSTLLVKLNSKDFVGAAAELDKWDHVSSKVVKGLLLRREAETKEFFLSNPT